MKEIFDFGRKILIVFFIALPFILFNSCEHLLDAPSIPNEKTTAGGTLSAPTGLKASQGLKRKINLSWNAVEGAKLYYIYKASNPNEEFVQVGETAEISYEIKASPGTTDYYRVVAAKSDGTRSPISAMSEAGASLALPVFSGADVDESTITVYWDMENASYYKEKLRFEVKQEDTATGITISRFVSGSESYSCVFENLESNSKYVYSIDAYLEDTPDEKENSGKSTVATMALRRPQPPKLSASEGEFKDKVRLNITLPPKVQVSINSDFGGIIETDYPVYFEISRKRGEKGAYEVIEKNLYYDGTNGDNGAAAGYDGYVAGNILVWDDKNPNEQDRGVKYEYKIKSYIDYNFSPQNGSPKTSSRESEPSVGWMSQPPKFTVKGEKAGSQYSVALGIAWDDMGKKDDYKFAIKLEKKNANLSDTGGEESWLANGDENFFATNIKSLERTYSIDKKMYYYTLYVVKSQVSSVNDIKLEENVLETVAASPILVADLNTLPKSAFSVDDGYHDKVVLKLEAENASSVSYKFVRKLNGIEEKEEKLEKVTFVGGLFEDTTVKGGKKYEYVMYATESGDDAISVPSEPKEAMTLGKPEPNIVMEGDGKKKLGYDAIYLEMYEVFGAKSYCLTLGSGNEFGGGKTLVFDADGKNASGMDADVSLVDQKFAITIKKPSGYDNAALAGKGVSLEVVARGYEDAARNEDKESKGILADAKVMGPATLTVSGSKENGVTENEITLKWNKVKDAIGYAIVRKRAEDNNNDVFYVGNSDKPKVSLADTTAAGASFCDNLFEVECDGNQYKFVDKAETERAANYPWLENQKRIAWGYEYTYTVIPLLAEGDAGLMLGSGGATDFTVKYENLDEKNKKVASGYTYGYGLNVKASKADYANKMKISWDVPKSARGNETADFKLYYKNNSSSGTGEWKSFSKSLTPIIKDGKAEVEFIVETSNGSTEKDAQAKIGRNDIMEYVVKYSPLYDDINGFYVKSLASTKDGNTDEPINMGYCFALTADEDGLKDISDHKSYEEKLQWKLYSKDRFVGPDGYRLYVKNHNLSDEWYPAATFDKDGKLISSENSEENNIQVKEGDPNAISRITIVEPNNTAELGGLLKVLRDYKHYYRIEAYRKNSEGVEIRTSIGGSGADYNTSTDDGSARDGYDYGDTRSVYAYRQITAEEMVRAATLAMAIGAKATGTGWNQGDGKKTYKNGDGETVVTVSTSGGSWSTDLVHTLSYNNFTPSIRTKAGIDVTFLTISGNVTGETWTHTLSSGTSGNNRPPYEYHCYNSDKITVSAANDDCKGLYAADIKFSWLNYEPNYRVEDGEKKGIRIVYPSGAQEKVFGNITPLPFNKVKGNWNKNDPTGFQQDSAEWQ